MSSIWEGSKVRLRAVEASDWEMIYRWSQDSDLARVQWYIPFPRSPAALKKEAEAQALEKPAQDEFVMMIETLAGEPVGRLNTHHCDLRTGTFRYGLTIDPQHPRQGYASETIRLLLRYFFEERRYQKCTVEIHEYNLPSIRLHEAAGFQQEARLRRMLYTRGQYYDLFYYGITAEEFAALSQEITG